MPNESETPGQDLIEKLKQDRPDIAITVSRSRDESFRWDGDGPDPEEDGYYAYDVDVTAIAIRCGEVIEGRDSLGGSYFQDDEPIGEVHGYLPQMVEEAVEELDEAIAARAAAIAACGAGRVRKEEASKVRQTSCRHCGQDIEGHHPYRKGEWRDRGNNTTCPNAAGDAGLKHAPTL